MGLCVHDDHDLQYRNPQLMQCIDGWAGATRVVCHQQSLENQRAPWKI
jgi:hypothetical protein